MKHSQRLLASPLMTRTHTHFPVSSTSALKQGRSSVWGPGWTRAASRDELAGRDAGATSALKVFADRSAATPKAHKLPGG